MESGTFQQRGRMRGQDGGLVLRTLHTPEEELLPRAFRHPCLDCSDSVSSSSLL